MPFVKRHKLYQLAKVKRTYYKYGTEPNATIVGSPTIDDGVVSGFTTGNYLTVTKSKPTIKSFEQVLKIRTGSDTASRQTFLSQNAYKGFGTLAVLDSKLIAYVSSDGSSNNIMNGTQSSLTLNTNTDYWIRYTFDGSKYCIDVSTNGQDYTNYISVTSSLVVYADGFFSFGLDTGGTPVRYPFLGSIDLSQSYININGKEWWHGTKAIESTSSDYDYYTDKLLSYDILNPNNYYKFTINPTPADATVTINGKNVNTVRLIKNSRIVWSVSAEGYAEQSGELRLSEDTVMDVVLEECAYVTDQVVFESATAGTYDVELLENGNYEVYCIAGGSGGAYVQHRTSSLRTVKASAGGGSGSGFIGVVLLEKSTYNIKVGEGGAATYTKDSSSLTGTTGGNSYINDLIVTYGGGAASVRGNSSDNRSGAGGSAPAVNVEIVSTTLNASGKSGSKDDSSVTDVAGGASVYEGYGAGGSAKSNGTSGYVKIVWKG